MIKPMEFIKHVLRAWPILLFLGTAGVWYWWWHGGIQSVAAGLANQHLDSDTIQRLGQIGDLFGGINALFAAFAFAGVGVAAYFQYQALNISKRQQIQQSFEPLFFHLLELHREVAAGMQLTDNNTDQPHAYHPQIATTSLRNSLYQSVRFAQLRVNNDRSEQATEIANVYERYYKANEEALGPYFRSLYHIFKLIDRSDIAEPMQVEYANIARSTLSKADILLLTLNCASDYGAEFKPLVEKYGLLKHVTRDSANETLDELVASWLYAETAVMAYPDRQEFWRKNRQLDPRNRQA